MPPMISAPATVRSAAVVNAEIRALAGRLALTDAERRRMIALWAEWQDAAAREQAARDAGMAA